MKNSLGAKRLERHLKSKRLSRAAFADDVGTTKAVVSCWARGIKTPQVRNALEIERATGIPLAAWEQPAR